MPLLTLLLVMAAVMSPVGTSGTFTDDDGNIHEANIGAIAAAGITKGCNPPQNDHFCPDDSVTRGEIAVFLTRALKLSFSEIDAFQDDDGHIFEGAINSIAAADITKGCNPPANTQYCPNSALSRGELAAMFSRVFSFPVSVVDWFVDDDGSLYESAIQRIATAGITVGCNPPNNTKFCPTSKVTRGELATFLVRSLGLEPIQPESGSMSSTTPDSPPTVEGTVTGDDCPCSVTGTVELEGTINLKGDLIVDGGTLVARSGVNVNGNGFQIMFMNGGKADFQGTPVFTWSDKGAKQNLSRDINFGNMRRIIFHQGAGKSILKYFAVTDSGGPNLGDYPLHWHLNGNSSRGTVVEGVVVINGAHHAYVPHGSHGITFKDTIARNTKGDAFWWDDPGTNNCDNEFRIGCSDDNSNDTVVDGLLVDGVTNAPGDDRGYRLSGIRLGSGSGNVMRNSTAINVRPSHVKDCSGFIWPEGPARPEDGGSLWIFEDNHGESDCHGIFTWSNDGQEHIVDGFTGGGISNGAYGNAFHYKNVDVPYVIIHASGWRISDSNLGDVVSVDHTFDGFMTIENSTMESFTLADPDREGIIHVLNGVNLSCGDIKYTDPNPNSRVVIDGTTC